MSSTKTMTWWVSAAQGNADSQKVLTDHFAAMNITLTAANMTAIVGNDSQITTLMKQLNDKLVANKAFES